MYANTKVTSIAYSKHARERMELRAITEEMVLKAILQPRENLYRGRWGHEIH